MLSLHFGHDKLSIEYSEVICFCTNKMLFFLNLTFLWLHKPVDSKMDTL